MPRLPQHTGQGTAQADKSLWHNERVRLEAQRHWGAQVVSVPASSFERAADASLKRILERLAIIFGFLFLFLNFALYLLNPSSSLRLTANPDEPQKSTQGSEDQKVQNG